MRYWFLAIFALPLLSCAERETFSGYAIGHSPFFTKSTEYEPVNIGEIFAITTTHEYIRIWTNYDSYLGRTLNVGAFIGQRDGDNAVRVGNSICVATAEAFDCTDEFSGLGLFYPYSIGQNGNHIGRIHRFEDD